MVDSFNCHPTYNSFIESTKYNNHRFQHHTFFTNAGKRIYPKAEVISAYPVDTTNYYYFTYYFYDYSSSNNKYI